MRTTEIAPLDKRHWRRLERRAVAAYERQLVSTLQRLGEEGTPVSHVEIVAGRAGTMLSLDLPEHRLALAGTGSGAWAALCPPGELGSPAMMLSDAGRYGRAWWLTLRVGGGVVTVLGSHIRLIPHTYGDAARDDPSGPVGSMLGTDRRAG